ncbi:MAG: GNAT family N-acetyltransferase [Acidimicrobiia bacterium]|nr:GNAT family N-acetyltransferase [Acidimicrobiia bacterium]
MNVAARHATPADLDELIRMYRLLEAEQAALRPLWPVADGLDEPIVESFDAILDDPDSILLVGSLDDVPLGFLWARPEDLLAQAGGEQVGVIRLIFTELEARGIGIGDAMITSALDQLRGRGLRYFDARVSPGHRHAKNFFEANGFKARLIFMHSKDDA